MFLASIDTDLVYIGVRIALLSDGEKACREAVERPPPGDSGRSGNECREARTARRTSGRYGEIKMRFCDYVVVQISDASGVDFG